MLEHNPTADVLFFVHAGFEPFVNIGRILRNVPFTETVRVHMWRVSRSEVPVEPRAQYRWLFSEFERMERWVAGQMNSAKPSSGLTDLDATDTSVTDTSVTDTTMCTPHAQQTIEAQPIDAHAKDLRQSLEKAH